MKNEWISVKDKLPNDDSEVLVCEMKCSTTVPMIYIGYYENEKWNIITDDGLIENCDDNFDNYLVTYWMELPDFPKKYIN